MPAERIQLDQEPVWDMQFDETLTQYRAFCLYRDLLEGRSLARVGEIWGRSPASETGEKKKTSLTNLQIWSSKNRWVERAEAYDLHIQRMIMETRESEIARMTRAEAQGGRTMVAIAMRRLMGYEDKEDPTKSVEALDPNKLTAAEAALLMRDGVTISRLSTNRPTSLIRGAMMITTTEFVQAANDLVEMLMRHIPEERKAIAADEVAAYGSGERRMLTQG